MKKILGMVILLGFVIMLGAAGGADNGGNGFAENLLFELLGMALSFFGMVALSHYKKYLRRRRRMCAKKRKTAAVCMSAGNFSERKLA